MVEIPSIWLVFVTIEKIQDIVINDYAYKDNLALFNLRQFC